MDTFLSPFRRWYDFKGRSSRREFWQYQLLCVFGIFVSAKAGPQYGAYIIWAWFVMMLIGVPLAVRRLHDTGRSGWWILLGGIGFVNLILLYWFLKDSQPGENYYGPHPDDTRFTTFDLA